jgi:hypothetical protein
VNGANALVQENFTVNFLRERLQELWRQIATESILPAGRLQDADGTFLNRQNGRNFLEINLVEFPVLEDGRTPDGLIFIFFAEVDEARTYQLFIRVGSKSGRWTEIKVYICPLLQFYNYEVHNLNLPFIVHLVVSGVFFSMMSQPLH